MSVTFACYFPAGKGLFIPIEIKLDAWVGQILEAIQVKLHSRGCTDITVDHLRLYKVTMFFLWHTPNSSTPGGCTLGPRRRPAIARPPVASYPASE